MTDMATQMAFPERKIATHASQSSKGRRHFMKNSETGKLAEPGGWSQLRRFLVFQLKLYVEAIRDVFLSGIALVAFLLDFIFQLKHEDSLFEKLLSLGRRSEQAINLFNQHDESEAGANSIDGIVRKVESKLKEQK